MRRRSSTYRIFETVNTLLVRKGLMLQRGKFLDATVIDAPSSTKNRDGECDPDIHQVEKGDQWHFGTKAHVGTDAESGLVQRIETTPANTSDVTMAHSLLHGEKTVVFGGPNSGLNTIEWSQNRRYTPLLRLFFEIDNSNYRIRPKKNKSVVK